MNAETRQVLAQGLGKLADAVHELRVAEAELDASESKADKEIAADVRKTLVHLSEAAASVSVRLWVVMLQEASKDLEQTLVALEA